MVQSNLRARNVNQPGAVFYGGGLTGNILVCS